MNIKLNNLDTDNQKQYLANLNHWLSLNQNNAFYYRLGIDTGVGSLGIAIIQDNAHGKPVRIKFIHSLTFDRGDIPKSHATKASKRRGHRATTHLVNRLDYRKKRINWTFQDFKLLSAREEHKALHSQMDLVVIRTKGLDRKLTNAEIYRIVYYFAKNRAYNQVSVNTSVKGVVRRARTDTDLYLLLAPYRTVGEMLDKDSHFKANNNQKHNRRGQYKSLWTHRHVLKLLKEHPELKDVLKEHHIKLGKSFSSKKNLDDTLKFFPSRKEVLDELSAILHEQQKLNPRITNRFINTCLNIVGYQRTFDMGVSEPNNPKKYKSSIQDRVGYDTFDHHTYVAPKASATFEYYRMLQNLNDLRYIEDGHWHSLNDKQRKIVSALRYKYQKITFKQVGKALKLSHPHFNNDDKKNLATFKATHQIGKCIGDIHNTDMIDKIAGVLSIFSNRGLLTDHLKKLHLSDKVIHKLIKVSSKNSFSSCGNCSIKSMKQMIPYMEQGDDVRTASIKAGLRPEVYKKTPVTLNDLRYVHHMYTNPTQIRSIQVIKKALKVIVNKLGRADYILVESGHAIKDYADARAKIEAIQKKNEASNKHIDKVLTRYNHSLTDENRLIYRLFSRQDGRDIYPPFEKLDPARIYDGTGYVQVDHAQPIGIGWNNSFNNKVLTTAAHNSEKGERTPLQWLDLHSELGKKFIAYVNKHFPKYCKKLDKNKHVVKIKKGKHKGEPRMVLNRKNIGIRTNLLRLVPVKAVNSWQPRDLTNNQTIAAFMYKFLRKHMCYRQSKYLNKQRTYMSTGMVTSLLRKAWGLKKDRSLSDKHHGIDAVLIAIASPGLRQRVDLFYKHWGKTNKKPKFPVPYKGFLEELKNAKVSVRRLSWKNETPPLVKDSKYGLVHLYDKGLIDQRRPLVDLKRKVGKDGSVSIGYDNNAWCIHPDMMPKGLFSKINNALKAHNNKPKKAFPHGYLINGTVPVYKILVYKQVISTKQLNEMKKKSATNAEYKADVRKCLHSTGVISRKYHCLRPYQSGLNQVLVFQKNHKYTLRKLYPTEIQNHQARQIRNAYEKQGYTYCFKLNSFDMIDAKLKKTRTLTFGPKTKTVNKQKIDLKPRTDKTNDFVGCFRRISNGGLLVQPRDLTSQGHAFTTIGMSSIKSLKRLQPLDFFGTKYDVDKHQISAYQKQHAQSAKLVKSLDKSKQKEKSTSTHYKQTKLF